MSNQTFREPRFRINASQAAKGLWQFDATIEYSRDRFSQSDSEDLMVKEVQTLGEKLLSIIKNTEDTFRKDGRKLVGDLE